MGIVKLDFMPYFYLLSNHFCKNKEQNAEVLAAKLVQSLTTT